VKITFSGSEQDIYRRVSGMDKKKFMRLAFAGLLVGRVVPVAAAPSDVASNVDEALQKARSEQRLSVQDIDALSAFDAEEEVVGLY
jgi:hypothetical protein